MNRSAVVPTVLAAALALSLPAAAEHRYSDVTIEERDAKGCAGVHVRFADRATARSEETVTLSRAEAKGLVLEGSRNGGVTVRGADASTFTVTACKAAAGDDDASAGAVLSKVALRSSGGRITVEGPPGSAGTGFSS